MNDKIKKLIDFHFSQKPKSRHEYELGYTNGRIKGYQDVLAMLGEHYDPATNRYHNISQTIIEKEKN